MRINVSEEIKVGESETATLWLTASFARDWFDDALRDARTGNDYHSRRREILFAVCFAESYLLEWVRDQVLRGEFTKLDTYFPPGQRRPIREKWKDIPKQLLANGLISAVPDYGQRYWQDWQDLVEYRDGLVHARASRPDASSLPPKAKPLPSMTDLNTMPAGWAVRVVVELVRRLHAAVDTPTPAWLVEP